MLNHVNQNETKPKRVVILGAKGFVGSSAVKRLQQDNIEVLALGREALDLNQPDAASQLAKILHSDDALMVISAKAPCKNHGMLLENVQMMNAVCDALAQQPVQHVIYISSDAVYTDSMLKLHEKSLAAPTSLHGVMHLARETMLQSVVDKNALAILRPSLLYGANDPHNGYGPNSFYRLALAGKAIELFGQGEEERDHVYIEDVAEIIFLCLMHRSHGILNIVTGEVASFSQIAKQVNQLIDKPVVITSRPRSMPMPHNGYRAFDNDLVKSFFPKFKFTSIEEGLSKMHVANLNTVNKADYAGS